MHIGIFSARSPAYHPNYRLMEAASALGHKVSLLHPKSCVSQIHPHGSGLKVSSDAVRVDVLLARIGATIKDYALVVIRQFELSGVPVINGFESILQAKNKFLTLQTLRIHGIPVPKSYFVSNLDNLQKAVSDLGGYPVVAKTPNSRQGGGVVLVDSPATAAFIMLNLPTQYQGIVAQEYIHHEGRQDIRAFVLADRVIGAMRLKPTTGDFRSNIHLRGRGQAVSLGPELSDLAVRSAKALGLEIAGIDLIVDAKGTAMVIEGNYSPGFKGLEAATGRDIAKEIIGYVTQSRGVRRGNRIFDG